MRIERIEETTEANRVAAESVARGRALDGAEEAPRTPGSPGCSPRWPACSLARPAGCDAKPRTAVLAEVGQLLGTAFGADHVGIYLSGDLVEAVIATPAPDAPRSPPSCSLAAIRAAGSLATWRSTTSRRSTSRPTRPAGRRLFDGRSARVFRPLALRRRALGSNLAAAAGWSRIHATLRVPCPGQNGPLALITLDGPFSRLPRLASAGRAGRGGRELGREHLERDRLGRELERCERSAGGAGAHGAPRCPRTRGELGRA